MFTQLDTVNQLAENIAEANERLTHLQEQGATAYAFDFRNKFLF